MNPLSIVIEQREFKQNIIGIYKIDSNLYFRELHNLQSNAKTLITNCNDWNKLKIKNEYNIYNKKNDINNIIKIDMCSRSYLKLIEMCKKFNLCNAKKINYLALAEAPGGFIEAFIHMRKQQFLGRNDNIVTMSLLSKNINTPKYIFKNKHNFNIKICSGAKGDGNLYDIENIKSIKDELDEKYNFITADGGLDFSKSYNNQEDMIFRLIFIETLTAFMYLDKKGTFILKIFDIFKQNTIELLYIISNFFEKVIIYKPFLSRNSNSEKYLICTNFRGIREEEIEKFKIIYKIIEDGTILNYNLVKMLPKYFVESLYDYNKNIIGNQVKNIIKTILEVNNYENILNNYNWCKTYGLRSKS